MAVSLLELADDLCSLEFAPEDMPAVKAAIAQLYGAFTSEQQTISATIRFGGAKFTFQNEWDDPCLIGSARMAAPTCCGGWPSISAAEAPAFS